MARIGPLLNSLPCYSAPPIPFKSAIHFEYAVVPQPSSYNLRSNVRYDRDFGMSAWSVPAVQQGRPYQIVDDTKKQIAPMAAHWPETEFVPIFHDPAFISPCASYIRPCTKP